MATPAEDPLVGHRVGRYTVKKLLESEELGKVYAATNPNAEPVRIKVLDPHLTENAEALARFGREMVANASIDNVNIVKMLDFGEHKGLFHFIVMEPLDARTLSSEIKAWGRIPVERVIAITAQIANALSSAHAENVVHRNLCPDNVLLLNNAIDGDYIKVRDFAYAHLQTGEESASGGLTAVNKRVGTVSYMAPEYIQTMAVDSRGDIYALGCVCFEMITGRPPFVGKTADVMQAHTSAPVPRPTERGAEIPAWLDDLVVRMLAKNPDDRPLSAFDVISVLRTGGGKPQALPALAPLGTHTAPAAPERPATPHETEGEDDDDEEESSPARSITSMAVYLGLGVLALALVVLLIVVALLLIGPPPE